MGDGGSHLKTKSSEITMATLISIGKTKYANFELKEDEEFIIGSDEKAHCKILDDPNVSKRHVSIKCDLGRHPRWTVMDNNVSRS